MKTLWAWLTGPRGTPETDPGDAYDPERDPVWCRFHGERVAAEQGEHRARQELARIRTIRELLDVPPGTWKGHRDATD